MITPEIVRDNYLQGAGFQPRLRSVDPQSQNSEDLIVEDNQIYHIEGSGVSLIGTSEIPLIGQYADQIIPNEKVHFFPPSSFFLGGSTKSCETSHTNQSL